MTNIDKIGYNIVEVRVYGKDKSLLKQEPILCAYEIQSGKIVGIGKMAFVDSVASLSRNTVCVINKSFSQLQIDGDKKIENDVDIYLEFVSEYYGSEYYQ